MWNSPHHVAAHRVLTYGDMLGAGKPDRAAVDLQGVVDDVEVQGQLSSKAPFLWHQEPALQLITPL